MASRSCRRCNDLQFLPIGTSIEIDIPKWHQTKEVELNPSNFADWVLEQAKNEPSISCPSCQLLWNGVEAVLGQGFHTRYNTMVLKNIDSRHRGGPMTVVLGNSWDLGRWKRRQDIKLNVKELQFYLPSGK
jgi:hypothetical protein